MYSVAVNNGERRNQEDTNSVVIKNSVKLNLLCFDLITWTQDWTNKFENVQISLWNLYLNCCKKNFNPHNLIIAWVKTRSSTAPWKILKTQKYANMYHTSRVICLPKRTFWPLKTTAESNKWWIEKLIVRKLTQCPDFGFRTVVQIKQTIWKRHLGFLEIVMDDFLKTISILSLKKCWYSPTKVEFNSQ